MSAIITEKFRQHNSNQFFESFTEASSTTYYLFIGKATAYTTATTGGSDSAPPTPADAVGETEFYAWDSMLAAKKIASTDVTYALPRRNWSNSTTLICTDTISVHQIPQHLVHQTSMTRHFTSELLITEYTKY